MSVHDSIPDKPDRETAYHDRPLYDDAYNDVGGMKLTGETIREWIQSDTYRSNFR